jgi:hypothetical protein
MPRTFKEKELKGILDFKGGDDWTKLHSTKQVA